MENLNEEPLTFCAKVGVRHLGASEGHCRMIRRTDVWWLVVCPAPYIGHKMLFPVITLITGKDPKLFKGEIKVLMSMQGLDYLQLKIFHLPSGTYWGGLF